MIGVAWMILSILLGVVVLLQAALIARLRLQIRIQHLMLTSLWRLCAVLTGMTAPGRRTVVWGSPSEFGRARQAARHFRVPPKD